MLAVHLFSTAAIFSSLLLAASVPFMSFLKLCFLFDS